MSTTLDYGEFDHEHDKDKDVNGHQAESFEHAQSDRGVAPEPAAHDAQYAEPDYSAPVPPAPVETNEYGVARATDDTDDEEPPVVAEGLGEHRPGESLGEWLRNDLEQTKEDFHLGGSNKDSS